MNDANKNLIIRIISAIVLLVPLGFSLFWSRPEALWIWAIAGVGAGLFEFYGITLKDEPVAIKYLGIAVGIAFAALLYYQPFKNAAFVGLIIATLIFAIVELFFHRDIKTATSNVGLLVLGLLYLPLMLTCVALMKRFAVHGAEWIVLAMSTTWVCDTGAYGVGRAIGKRKLYPAISPNKSIEGAVGGVVFATLAGIVIKFTILPELLWIDVFLICIPGALLGMIGDLVESMIKRGYGVKDSGKLIPGHGGLLDRIDALLFVLPYIYLYAQYIVLAR